MTSQTNDAHADARGMWADKAAYDKTALDLSNRFNRNFEKFHAVHHDIAEAAPVGG